MKNSLHIGSPFGIKVMIHWTFLILIGYVIYIDLKNGNTPLQIAFSISFILSLFVCVVLHELGHALAARRYGISTRSITLLPIGGVANLDKIPEEPRKELFVAIAGPLVNIGIAAIILIILLFTGFNLSDITLSSYGFYEFLPALLAVNLALVAFNLIPAFPMDGGRLFRAGLALKFNRVKATFIAARTGQFFAILFAIWGFYNNPFLVVIALFIFIAAQAELKDVQSKSILAEKKAGEFTLKNYTLLVPEMPLGKVVEILLNGQEEEFVVIDNEKPVGILTKNNIIKGLSEQGQSMETGKIMTTDFITVNAEDSIKEVFERMQHSECSVFPVLSEGKFIGTIDQKNIHEYLLIHEALRRRTIS